ncbi:MAG: FMN-dependent NADH-azoreductase [Planctomycetota bacterium]
MSKLLYIKASPRVERSKSAAVADAFIGAYRQNNPKDVVDTLNLFEESMPTFDGLAVQAKYVILHGKEHSEEELQAWAAVEKVIERFVSADKYVLAVPMWNFSIPYRLKQYIDILVQPGYTFSYSEDAGYKGLVPGKPLLAVYARGGEYPKGSDAEAFDLQKKYIELVFGFMGFEDIRSICAEPMLMGGPDVAADKVLQAVEEAKAAAAEF